MGLPTLTAGFALGPTLRDGRVVWPALTVELDREDDRGLRALDAVDTADGIQIAVDLVGTPAFDAHLLVEHPR